MRREGRRNEMSISLWRVRQWWRKRTYRGSYAVGGLIVLIALVGLIEDGIFILRSDAVTGAVSSAKLRRPEQRRYSSYDVTIEFQTIDGVAWRAVLEAERRSETPNTPGAPVDIFYLRSDPTKIRRNSTAASWGISAGVGLVGIILIAGTIAAEATAARTKAERRRENRILKKERRRKRRL